LFATDDNVLLGVRGIEDLLKEITLIHFSFYSIPVHEISFFFFLIQF